MRFDDLMRKYKQTGRKQTKTEGEEEDAVQAGEGESGSVFWWMMILGGD